MSFSHWLFNRVPHADRLLLLIQQAGSAGIPEGQLRSQVELPKRLVDDLLAALVQTGQVAVVEREGRRVYFER
jgi:hypothetical protein